MIMHIFLHLANVMEQGRAQDFPQGEGQKFKIKSFGKHEDFFACPPPLRTICPTSGGARFSQKGAKILKKVTKLVPTGRQTF